MIKKILKGLKSKLELRKLFYSDYKRFKKYSFENGVIPKNENQLLAIINKTYHSIEKGLSYSNIRFHFGRTKIEYLIQLIRKYILITNDKDNETLKTALKVLHEYVAIHHRDHEKLEYLRLFLDEFSIDYKNTLGGVRTVSKDVILDSLNKDFYEFSKSRVSVRDFSDEPVDVSIINKALNLARHTPSACNRQSWRTRVIDSKQMKNVVLQNQNGNEGYGQNLDKIILITTDSRSFAKPRERKQAYIDGGLYSMNLLYALHYYGVACISLSAALNNKQENIIRKALNVSLAENFIMFIGLGSYKDEFKVPMSHKNEPQNIII
jgi:nitroreductase